MTGMNRNRQRRDHEYEACGNGLFIMHQISRRILPIRPRASFHCFTPSPLVCPRDVAPLVQAVSGDGTLLLGRVGGYGAVAVTGRHGTTGRGSGRKSSDTGTAILSHEKGEVETAATVSDRLQHIVEDNSSPLTASKAIDLISQFMAVVPHSTREDMDKLKMLDKFLNTARALMETRLKTEDARELSDRLDAIEKELV